MKLGVFAVLLAGKPLEEALKYLSELGVQAVELGTGGYPGDKHVKPDEYLSNPAMIDDLKEMLKRYNLEISALSCHGNPVHPQKEIADDFHNVYEKTVLLAEKLDVKNIVTFSGCPGDGSENAKSPNWVTCPWPSDFLDVLEYQWNEVLIPYWDKTAKFTKEHGARICLEMHPGFCVYNPETLLKLRAACGETVGANFDPSHLFWQGIDACAAIRQMGDAIHYFHAKDSRVDPINASQNGVLDTKKYTDELQRSWLFRTVGYGHSHDVWKDIISTLKLIGYDGVISIEHEDSLMSVEEGLKKAISFLKEVLVFEKAGEIWWA